MPQNFFKSNFKFLRKKAGETQAESGSALERLPQTISGWENGGTEPTLDDLINISIKYGISIDNLLKADLANGKGIEEQINSQISKGKGKETGKATNETADSAVIEALKATLVAKDEIIASKLETIAGLKQNNDDLRGSISILNDQILMLKREVSELERQIESRSGGHDASGHRRSA